MEKLSIPRPELPKGGDDPSNNRAKLSLELSMGIERSSLKPHYGERFGGAPLRLFSVPCPTEADEKGSRDAQVHTSCSTNVGGYDHV
jgi:hypothetical protein